MPTDPTTRDVETARRLSPCVGYPCGTLDTGTEHVRRCPGCFHADAIARALATARAEERERAIAIAERMALDVGTTSTAAHVAAAIRAARSAS